MRRNPVSAFHLDYHQVADAFARRPDQISISYNGGKDCMYFDMPIFFADNLEGLGEPRFSRHYNEARYPLEESLD